MATQSPDEVITNDTTAIFAARLKGSDELSQIFNIPADK
jgi:hypothetical protein